MRKNKRLRKLADPFSRIYRMNQPLDIDSERPLQDCLPGEWPTWGEFKSFMEALTKELAP